MASNSNKNDREEEEYIQCAWKSLQREELTELEEAVGQAKKGEKNEDELSQLIEKIIQHFQNHSNNRIRLAKKDVSPFLAPSTCTPLENSVLYAVNGFEPDSQVNDPCVEEIVNSELRTLNRKQLSMINELQEKTIREERRISTKYAGLQEDIVDQPLAGKMKKEGHDCENADEALDEHSGHMAGVIEEADQLRMKTLKEIVDIFAPVQALKYLAASKKIRMCVEQWGKKRDQEHNQEY